MTKTLAVDFDGVIHKYSKGWQDGTIYDDPMEGAKEALLRLMDNYAVFIHTARDPEQVAEWMNTRLFPEKFDEWNEEYRFIITEGDAPARPGLLFWNNQELILVTSRKLPAVAYIDDRAVPFSSWDRTMLHLEHWIDMFQERR